ncbi:DUF1272 domain-containing protein [Sphingobacteriales bacterium UPWRP_1]|nr:hypothetical protein BVG80_14715 [Sphingobacteriales bacterium TSM_CSM]PSJ76563.1 DUF1272 domain-containing protein [Sphingobacteriales bacterium UPWRP_1]
MLELRPICENCGKHLPPNSLEAMICSFECTFCTHCVAFVLHNVCPNCGGGFVQRPVRPADELLKYPAVAHFFYKPVDMQAFAALSEKYKNTAPHLR